MHSGAEWLKASLEKEMSPLGEAVANLLGRVFAGIYHLPSSSLKRVDWSDPYCIEFTFYGELATFDFSHLTALVVFGHDEMIRISIRGCGPGYIKMMFHQRSSRTGSMSERYPIIEDHIMELRKWEKAA